MNIGIIKRLKLVFYFYRRFVIPLIVLSLIIALLMYRFEASFWASFVGISGITLPVFHFSFYEISYPHEYVFYNNLGWNKLAAWSTTAITAVILLITALLI